jgi:nucleoside-diphosphate-sugar epimerase
MKVVVTGATGYIGSRLVKQAMALNNEVICASRRRPRQPIAWISFDCSTASEFALPPATDIVFHLAAVTDSVASAGKVETSAAERLISASAAVGARVIFISSQTARQDAPTDYGRVKWQIERQVLATNGVVVRVGLVYGGTERALFGQLVDLVRRFAVIPAFIPAPMVQPIHVDDLVAFLLRCADLPASGGRVLCVGASEPLSFTEFLRCIARSRLRRFRFPVPIPKALVEIAARASGHAELGRIVSLFELRAMETVHDMAELNILPRPLDCGMERSGNIRRRHLIREARGLLSYVLKTQASVGLVRRYVRCMECLDHREALPLPQFVLSSPLALALLDDPALLLTPTGRDLSWRLSSTVALAEASIEGARRFQIADTHRSFFNAALDMSQALAFECLLRVLRWLTWPLLRLALRKTGFTL